jgi:2-dehydro-3-deoxyphosphogluconate aldolase/(4S)-4-hydroxy-2-oxoglutarate aldolase
MSTLFDRVLARRLIPVVTLEDAAAANPLADALVTGGLPVAEITLRSSIAIKAIEMMARRKDLIVGAGTVLTVAQVQQALDAGAQFMVSPGFNPEMVRFCQDRKIPVLPGVSTPTEIQVALDHGVDIVKFFPAEAFGGCRTLRAIGAPYPTVRFVPTGGITADNLADYLCLPQVVACGASWMTSSSLVASARFEAIRQRIVAALEIVAEVERRTVQ